MSGEEAGFGKRKRRKFRFVRFFVVLTIVIVLLGVLGIPLALQNRNFVVSMANRYAGVHPLRIELSAVEAGWMRPIKVRDFKLLDAQGAPLVQVNEIETELTLLNLVSNYQNLKKVTVKGAEVKLEVLPGTTNIEQALQPLLSSSTSSTPSNGDSTPSSSVFAGRIVIADAVIHATDSVDQTSWDLVLNQVDLPIPTPEQPIPPTTLLGTIQQTKAIPGEVLMGGQFSIRTEPLAQPIPNVASSGIVPTKMTIVTNGLPLHWFSLVRRRLPEIPIEHLSGLATVQTEVEVHNNQSFFARIHTAQIDSLRLIAPAIVGERGAALRLVKLSGNVQTNHGRYKAEGLVLQTDVGSITASADLPTQLTIPTIGQPWMVNSDYEIEGTIDLANLVQVAPSLIPVQKQVQLTSGRATLKASQRSTNSPSLPPNSTFQLALGGLKANVNGTPMSWDEALSATVNVTPTTTGQPSLKLDCLSEFGTIKGEGDLLRGSVAGSFELDKMHNRLSQWISLPMKQVHGAVVCNMTWKQDEGNRLVATGAVRTTPISIVNQYGELNEPKWDGGFQLIARLDRGQIIQIDRANLELKADVDELLSASIVEPVSLMPNAPGAGQLPPAGMQLKLLGDLTGWQRRAQLLLGVDPGIIVGGQCNLEARGIVNAASAEIQEAALDVKSFRVQSGTTSFSEPQLVGKFKGKVNTNDISKLQIESLLVQSLSLAMQATDQASPNQTGSRVGNAAYRINPAQFMESLDFGQGANTISLSGDVTGTAQWQIDPTSIKWALQSTGVDIKAMQLNTPAKARMVSTGIASNENLGGALWYEPKAELVVEGNYSLQSGRLDVSKAQMMTDWIAYGGVAAMTSDKQKTIVQSKGQIVYEASQVAAKLKPWTGNSFTISGQKTQPLDIVWTSNTSPTATWADSLQASSQIGWDGANVMGIPIGTADIPIVVKDGHLLTQADIPVSQGRLKWNLDGNLGANPMRFVQSPDTVIDNVAITPQMCQAWLRFVAPMLADVTSIQGNLSLKIDEAILVPTEATKQTVKGKLVVHGANVGPGPLADQMLGIVQQIRNFKKGLGMSDAQQQSNWLQMPLQEVGFQVENGRVLHRDMKFQVGDIVLSTNGSVGLDGSLELNTSVPILKDWVEKSSHLLSLAGQQILIPIRGTVQRPQLDFSGLTSLGQQLATSALRGEAQKQIDKGLNKLLGPLGQGMQQMQQGMQNNLPQLPNLQGFQIPGFGGGAPQQPPPSPPQNP